MSIGSCSGVYVLHCVTLHYRNRNAVGQCRFSTLGVVSKFEYCIVVTVVVEVSSIHGL